MPRYLLAGGTVVDPVNGIEGEVLDVLIDDGRIAAIGRALAVPDARRVDCHGLHVVPGFVDMHVHLREPGGEESETLETGLGAAVAGGFTAVACMANTSPVNDSVAVTEHIVRGARQLKLARVWPIAAVTLGLNGEQLTNFAELRDAGAVAVSDDGRPIASSERMRQALELAGELGMLLSDHCEDPTFAPGWCMNEGPVARRLSRRGQAVAGEEVQVARDAILSRLTGAPVHCAHISGAATVARLREEKSRGTRISAEVTPHHFVLTDAEVEIRGSDAKMNPPLRAEADRLELLRGLSDGTIDCIATDHAPHAAGKKAGPFDCAANGVVGLETAVALALDRLVGGGVIPLARLVQLLSVNPARLLGVTGGALSPAAPADVTLLDLQLEQVVDPSRFRSRSRNTPFAGIRLRGGAVATVVAGRVVHSAVTQRGLEVE